jgi:ubiquinone/menaquinone biosynthesis C-methylase UbiE
VPSHPIFAAVYGRVMDTAENAGLREIRAGLFSQASGRTLEVGAGTGLDVAHFGPQVSDLVLTEPDPHMAKRLREAVAERQPQPEVTEAPAESLPFEDASFDTVVSGLVLCTVTDATASIAEAARVLRPGGRLLFLEHVHDEDGSGRARWQDRLERPWGFFAGGCHPNRRTVEAIEASPLRIESLEMREFPKAPLIRPLAVGVAVR